MACAADPRSRLKPFSLLASDVKSSPDPCRNRVCLHLDVCIGDAEMSLQPLLGLEVWRVCGCLRFALIRVVAQCEQLFCAALEDRFDMAAPIRVGPTLLSIVSNAEMEDIISTFMADDKFIVLVGRACSRARVLDRLQERRFYFVLSTVHWCTGIG